jgi:diacylglycerol kinase (ATP)
MRWCGPSANRGVLIRVLIIMEQTVLEQCNVLEETGPLVADETSIEPPYSPQRVPLRSHSPQAEQFGRREGETNFVSVDRPFSVLKRLRSFKYAFQGIGTIMRTQHSAWLHTLASTSVIVVGFLFGISGPEWCWIILAIMGVWTAEALNTAFELLCDVASPEFHPLVKKAKDASAGAVLISAVGSAIIGFCILAPHAMRFFGGNA